MHALSLVDSQLSLRIYLLVNLPYQTEWSQATQACPKLSSNLPFTLYIFINLYKPN
jgi:hypothetical protein